MKKILMTLAAGLCCTITVWAQGFKTKMSPWLQGKYEQHQTVVKRNGGPLRVQGRQVRKYMLTLVESTDQAQSVCEKGGVVMQDFGMGICAAFLPMDSLGAIEQCASVLRLEANEPSCLMNDTSAVIIGVDKVWEGKSYSAQLPQAFTGKGVVAAVMDVGFDFTHPAFRNDDGTSRIKWFWDLLTPYANNDSFGMIFATPAEVLAAQHSTDAFEENHGTHVLGSMAGRGLNGNYVGMAPEADIMGAYVPLGELNSEWLEAFQNYLKAHLDGLSDLEDIVLQVDMSQVAELVELCKIFEQAEAAGQPCVVNWSFGAPNDFYYDNSLYEQVFNSLVGPGRIVVVSAGNNGGEMTYVKKEAYTPLDQYVSYAVVDKEQFSLWLMVNAEDPDFRIGLTFKDVSDTLFFNIRNVIETATDDKTYETEIPAMKLVAKADPVPHGRVAILLRLMPQGDYLESIRSQYEDLNIVKTKGNVVIDAPAEVHLMGIYGNTEQIVFAPEYTGNSRGCHQGTVGAPAIMDRAIAVGAMHHRTTITNYEGVPGTTLPVGSQEGKLVSFSSCGPTLDGRIKPDVVAPGYNIISALNSFYRVNYDMQATYNKVTPLTTYRTYTFGNYYGMWAKSGTSMSSPIAAGVIALWLQAKPDLTPEDILGVIQRTSHQPEPEFSGTDKNVYYGWGEIDAYAGLLDILELNTAIPEISKHQPAYVKFRVADHTLYIDGLDEAADVTVYNLSGSPVLKTTVTGDAISLAGLPAGVYAVQVGALGSTLIRL